MGISLTPTDNGIATTLTPRKASLAPAISITQIFSHSTHEENPTQFAQLPIPSADMQKHALSLSP